MEGSSELLLPEPLGDSPRRRPPRHLAKKALRLALDTAFRGLRPGDGPLSRFWYDTDDGWRCPLYTLPPCPGASGEPVLLAHGLCTNHHSLHYERANSLAWTLQQAGFAVFLLGHRGQQDAVAPSGAEGFDFDDLAFGDLPAAIDAIRERTGFDRVHFVGHGLGGQLLYAFLARGGAREIGAASTLCAGLRFSRPATYGRALSVACQLLPQGLTLPTRQAARFLAPALRSAGALHESLGAPRTGGDIIRGLLLHGTENLPCGLLAQALLWQERGFLCDRSGREEFLLGLAGLETPLLVVAAGGDSTCSPPDVQCALEPLKGPTDLLLLDRSWGHLDPLLAPSAGEIVASRVARWLDLHRRAAWSDPTPVSETGQG